MRKLFASMCITAVLAAVCGCGNETKPTTTTTPPTTTPETPAEHK
jgi:hypothetical protein